MKKMTCEQLGGACQIEFEANTFEEMAEKSKKHGMKMYQKGDPAHLEAMNKMQQLMQSQEEMQKWFKSKEDEFNALPEVG